MRRQQAWAYTLLLLFGCFCCQLTEAQQSQTDTTYRFIVPAVADQGTFTGKVVAETDQGQVPLSAGDQLTLNGEVVGVEGDGTVTFPPLPHVGDNVINATVVGKSKGKETPHFEPCSVNVIAVPEGLAPRIYHASEITTDSIPLRVQGQALDKITAAALVNDQTRIPLSKSVGSSLERIYFSTAGNPMPKGKYTFVAADQSGKQLKAPNTTSNPHMMVSGR